MGHHVSDNNIKGRILRHNPILSIIKRTLIIDYYDKELLLEKRKTSTVNHEDALKSIPEKNINVFGPLLNLWQIIDDEKQATCSIIRII